MNKKNTVIFASGKGSNAKKILELWKAGKLPHVEIAAVISDRQDAPVLDIAKEFGVKSMYLDTMQKGARFSAEGAKFYLQNLQFVCAEIIVLAGFMKIVPNEIIDAYPNKIINLHPSILPAFKAAKNAIGDAWNMGVKISGCTVHFVTPKIDDGKIIAQKAVDILPEDTRETFEEKIHAAEHALLPYVLEDLAAGRI